MAVLLARLIFDQIGNGFHRYAVDRKWHVPHFEKMLYDQALLVMAFGELYQLEKHQEYSRAMRNVMDYVLNRMTAPGGVFYSAEDADSDGGEGRFYLWRNVEIRRILKTREANLFFCTYALVNESETNQILKANSEKTGVLHRIQSDAEAGKMFALSPIAAHRKLNSIRESCEKKVINARGPFITIQFFWTGIVS